jgi:hypothetical protein
VVFFLRARYPCTPICESRLYTNDISVVRMRFQITLDSLRTSDEKTGTEKPVTPELITHFCTSDLFPEEQKQVTIQFTACRLTS